MMTKQPRISTRSAFLGLCLLAAFSSRCTGEPVQPALDPLETDSLGLFLDTRSSGPASSEAHVSRSRFVKINFALLLDEEGQVLELPSNTELTLNLFPDVTYSGVIDRVERNGDEFAWTGHLKGIEYSSLTMVFTSGIFLAQIASPAGIYEVSNVGDDLYRVILIDQTKLPGGRGETDTPPSDP
jgi:hypothetical protein